MPTLLGVLALTCAALWLRLWGLDVMLPHTREPDGAVLVRQVALLESGTETPELEDNWSFYPHLVARVIALLPDVGLREIEGPTLADHLRQASAPYVQVRTGVAVLAVLIVPATWLVARRFLDRRGAFFAAALVATSQLDLWFSHQGRPHAPAASMTTLAVLALMHLRARASIAAYAWGGVACAAAIGTLQSGLAVLLPLAAAHLLRERAARAPFWRIAITLGIVAAGCAWLYPFLLNPPPSEGVPILELRPGTFEFFGHSIFLGMFRGEGFKALFWSLWCFEWVTTVLALVGLALWAWRARARRADAGARTSLRERLAANADLMVVLAYVLPYACVTGLYGRAYERFFIQLVPFVAVLAAFAFARALALLERRGPRPLLAGSLAALLLAVPCIGAVNLSRVHAAPDSVELAAKWIADEAQLRPRRDRIVLVPFLDVPLFHSYESLIADSTLGWSTPWRAYLAALDPTTPRSGSAYDLRSMPLGDQGQRALASSDPYGYLSRVQPDFVMLNVPLAGQPDALRGPFVDVLRARAKLVFRSPPEAVADPDYVPIGFQDLPAGMHRNWSLGLVCGYSTFGPVVEVYAFDPQSPLPGLR